VLLRLAHGGNEGNRGSRETDQCTLHHDAFSFGGFVNRGRRPSGPSTVETACPRNW
jgi:hypothetical protein